MQAQPHTPRIDTTRRPTGRAAARVAARLAACALAALAAGCSMLGPRMVVDRDPQTASTRQLPGSAASPGTGSRPGGYYKDDGPGDNPPDLAAVPEPEPRVEPLHRFANNPYNVFGVPYTPMTSLDAPYRQRGLGSWYGRKFHGQKTSSGEVYDMYGMTAAHPTLPIPSYARVLNPGNGRSIIVRVNDRGPFHTGRIIDLSYTAAWKLGYVTAGSTPLEVELLTPQLIAALKASPRPGGGSGGTALAQAAPPAVPAGAPVVTALASPPPPQARPVGAATGAPATAPAALPAPAQTLPLEVQSGGVFLQLAAFSARDNAEAFRARLSRELDWLGNAVQVFQKDGLFRLHVGPYKDRNEAGGIAERLRTELQLRPMIVVR